MIQIKRTYEPAAEDDGRRVLVDRLWPRGLSRDRFKMDEWMKDLGPSHELRKWFGHRPERWEEFQRRYREELQGRTQRELLERLAADAQTGTVTLLYSARDAERNQAVLVARILSEAFGTEVAGLPVSAEEEACPCMALSAEW